MDSPGGRTYPKFISFLLMIVLRPVGGISLFVMGDSIFPAFPVGIWQTKQAWLDTFWYFIESLLFCFEIPPAGVKCWRPISVEPTGTRARSLLNAQPRDKSLHVIWVAPCRSPNDFESKAIRWFQSAINLPPPCRQRMGFRTMPELMHGGVLSSFSSFFRPKRPCKSAFCKKCSG